MRERNLIFSLQEPQRWRDNSNAQISHIKQRKNNESGQRLHTSILLKNTMSNFWEHALQLISA